MDEVQFRGYKEFPGKKKTYAVNVKQQVLDEIGDKSRIGLKIKPQVKRRGNRRGKKKLVKRQSSQRRNR